MEGNEVRGAIAQMIGKLLDDSNFKSMEEAQQMIARGETVQKLVASEVEARRVDVERDKVTVYALETAGKYGIDADSLGLPRIECKR